jgi:hypothetical protein
MSFVLPVPSHRAIRAALFAVVCVGVAAALHGAAGGCQVTWAQIGLGLPPIWLAAWAGLGGERSGPVLTAGLGAAQIGLHYLFAHLGAATATAAAASTAATHTATTAVAAMSMPGMPGMAMQQPNVQAKALAMSVAHTLAVAVCGWWLRQGERDFFALCRAVAALTAAPLRRLARVLASLGALARTVVTYDDVPRAAPAPPCDGLRRRRTPVLTAVSFRGPPVAFA